MIRNEPLTMVQSVDGVFDALGGISAVRDLTGVGHSVLSNWKKRGRIPASTFLIFRDALERRGIGALPALWGIAEPVELDRERSS